jgi:hypothetical protein
MQVLRKNPGRKTLNSAFRKEKAFEEISSETTSASRKRKDLEMQICKYQQPNPGLSTHESSETCRNSSMKNTIFG